MVQVTEGTDEGQDVFVVRTDAAVYYYQKDAGGFSSIHDRDGIDWLNFKTTSHGYPGDAGGVFRGLPNAVFPDGMGHPGHARMHSRVADDNTIISDSDDGQWSWSWTFDDVAARFAVMKVPTGRSYWFLYEGTPGGRFAPTSSFWGTDVLGRRTDSPDFQNDDDPCVAGSWRWAYFGLTGLRRSLCIACHWDEPGECMFAYLGATPDALESADGMTVFGFGRPGRSGSTLTSPQRFTVTFVESERHDDVRAHLDRVTKNGRET